MDGYIDVDIHKGASNADVNMAENKEQHGRTEFVFQPPDQNRLPAKRLRVSDINVSRYDEEFVEELFISLVLNDRLHYTGLFIYIFDARYLKVFVFIWFAVASANLHS